MKVILFSSPLSCSRILKKINKAISLLLQVICHRATAFFKEVLMTVAAIQNTPLKMWNTGPSNRYILLHIKDTGRGKKRFQQWTGPRGRWETHFCDCWGASMGFTVSQIAECITAEPFGMNSMLLFSQQEPKTCNLVRVKTGGGLACSAPLAGTRLSIWLLMITLKMIVVVMLSRLRLGLYFDIRATMI